MTGCEARLGNRHHQNPCSSRGHLVERLGSPYVSVRSRHWVKSKKPAAPAVKREAEEDWGAMTQRRDMNVRARPLKISKAKGASRQVEEAIKAVERGDFDIAVTLAGAAEGMLKRSGHHLWSFMLRSPQAAAFDEKKELVPFLNAQRDWLKHPNGSDTMTLTRAHAAFMIARAMSKLETWSPRMKRFKRWYEDNLDAVLREWELP